MSALGNDHFCQLYFAIGVFNLNLSCEFKRKKATNLLIKWRVIKQGVQKSLTMCFRRNCIIWWAMDFMFSLSKVLPSKFLYICSDNKNQKRLQSTTNFLHCSCSMLSFCNALILIWYIILQIEKALKLPWNSQHLYRVFLEIVRQIMFRNQNSFGAVEQVIHTVMEFSNVYPFSATKREWTGSIEFEISMFIIP